MSGSDDDTEKTHDPTPKKLEDARRRGEVPRSMDVITASAYSGFFFAATAFGIGALQSLAGPLSMLLGQPDRFASLVFEGSATSAFAPLTGTFLSGLVPWLGLPACAALLAVLVQRSFVVAGEKIIPKASRISPISNAKNKFGANGLFEFGKSTVKLIVYSIALAIFLIDQLPILLLAPALGAVNVVGLMFGLATDFLFVVLMIAAAIGIVDLIWQQAEHTRQNRMSLQEIRDEAKEQEGDGSQKQARRQRGYELATNRMLVDVPKADVIITNPTHFAVALRWSRMPGSAPICVAKGVDEVALRIRELGTEAGVPIQRDPPTARWLHADVNVGSEIWPEHYEAVAAAIRFAEKMRAMAKSRGNW